MECPCAKATEDPNLSLRGMRSPHRREIRFPHGEAKTQVLPCHSFGTGPAYVLLDIRWHGAQPRRTAERLVSREHSNESFFDVEKPHEGQRLPREMQRDPRIDIPARRVEVQALAPSQARMGWMRGLLRKALVQVLTGNSDCLARR